jgi:trans-aconitate methyltransferase
MGNWAVYSDYWDNHARDVGHARAVTGLDEAQYPVVIGKVLDLLAPPVVRHVVDVGCGAGLTYPLVRERWPQATYIGLDVSAEMVRFCKAQYPEADWRLIERPELPDESVDFIICHSVFTHIVPQDVIAYLQEFWNVLSPKGTISASIHVDCAEGCRGDVTRMDYAPAWFEQQVEQCGLQVFDIVMGHQWTYGLRQA